MSVHFRAVPADRKLDICVAYETRDNYVVSRGLDVAHEQVFLQFGMMSLIAELSTGLISGIGGYCPQKGWERAPMSMKSIDGGNQIHLVAALQGLEVEEGESIPISSRGEWVLRRWSQGLLWMLESGEPPSRMDECFPGLLVSHESGTLSAIAWQFGTANDHAGC